MRVFIDLILAEQSWLVNRVFNYAKRAGYTQYAATQQFQWDTAVEGLCKSMVALLEQNKSMSEFAPAMDFSLDPVVSFGIDQANRHLERGVSLSMFFGLLKFFRRSFNDLIESQNYPHDDSIQYHVLVIKFFDLVEMGVIESWTKLNETELVIDLQSKNLQLTRVKSKYQVAIGNLPDAVILASPVGIVEDINAAAASLLDIAARDGELLTPDEDIDLPWLPGLVAQCEASPGGSYISEITFPVANKAVSIRVRCVKPRSTCGRFTGYIVILDP